MRIAVFSDVHGNFSALRSVLDEIDRNAPFDHIVCAGDLCFGGDDPARCIDLLQSRNIECIYGNTDWYIYESDAVPDEQHAKEWDNIQRISEAARMKIGDEGISYLRSLPFDLRYSPTDNPNHDLLVVHANPRDVHYVLYPSEERQLELFNEIRQPDDDQQLEAMLADVQAAVMAYGHLHTSFIRPWRHLTLVDVASVSMQVVDNDRRARYSIFIRQDDKWSIDQRFVEYV